jgi:hypothetical protein
MSDTQDATMPRFVEPAFLYWAAETTADTPGAAERILSRHTATPEGLCGECGKDGATWWPCTPATVAQFALARPPAEEREHAATCIGCGLALPSEARRDYRGRFHGAACRQHAHNARRNQQHSEISRALAAVESAVAELKRVVSAAQTVLDDAGQGPEPIS